GSARRRRAAAPPRCREGHLFVERDARSGTPARGRPADASTHGPRARPWVLCRPVQAWPGGARLGPAVHHAAPTRPPRSLPFAPAVPGADAGPPQPADVTRRAAERF